MVIARNESMRRPGGDNWGKPESGGLAPALAVEMSQFARYMPVNISVILIQENIRRFANNYWLHQECDTFLMKPIGKTSNIFLY